MSTADPLSASLVLGEGALVESRCDIGQPKNFLRPCLLLLLAEAPAHGYELIERLRPFGFELSEPATVYRTLRQIEEHGLVRSHWELSERGPARRVYTLTPEGLEHLSAWSETLRATQRVLAAFLARAQRLEENDAAPQRERDRLLPRAR